MPADTISVVGVARFDSIAARMGTRPPPPGPRRVMFAAQTIAAQGKSTPAWRPMSSA